MKRIISGIMAFIFIFALATLPASAEKEGKWVGILRVIDDQEPELFPKAEYNDDGVRFIPPEGMEHFMGGLLYDTPISVDDFSIEVRVDQLLPKEDMMSKWIGVAIMDKPVLNPKSPDQGNGIFMLFFINATGVVSANAYLYLANNEAGVPETVTVNADIYNGGTIKFNMKENVDGYTVTVNNKSFKYPFTELKEAFPDGKGNVTVAAYSYTDYSKSDFTIVNFNGKNPSTGGQNAVTSDPEGNKTTNPGTNDTGSTQTPDASDTTNNPGDGNNQIILIAVILAVVLVIIIGVIIVVIFKKKKPDNSSDNNK